MTGCVGFCSSIMLNTRSVFREFLWVFLENKGYFYCVILKEEGELLVFAYHDTMVGPSSERDDQLTLHGSEGDD